MHATDGKVIELRPVRDDRLLTLREVADRLKLNPETLRRMCKRREIGHIPGKGRGSPIKFKPSQVEQYIQRHTPLEGGDPGLALEAEIIDASIPSPLQPGIYFLIRNGQVMYVGQSATGWRRIREHQHAGRVFDRLAFIPVPDAQERLALEGRYIREFRPPWNRQGL